LRGEALGDDSGAIIDITLLIYCVHDGLLAYNYLNILMDAIYMMEEDLKTKTVDAALKGW